MIAMFMCTEGCNLAKKPENVKNCRVFYRVVKTKDVV